MAPASPTRVVSRPIAEASAVTAIRMVIENPALGSRLIVKACLRIVGGGRNRRSEQVSTRPARCAATRAYRTFSSVVLPTSAAGQREYCLCDAGLCVSGLAD